MTQAPTRPDSATLAAHLLDVHAASGRWAQVIADVPRGQFVPNLVWVFDSDTGASVAVDRRVDPDAWARAVYSDTALTVQWDDGEHHGREPGTVPTSSASQPSVVAGMLDDARLGPGMRVLEAGTGTGWSAALTAHATGPGTVVTVEFDPQVWAGGRNALWRAGVDVEAVHGDAAKGHEAGAPYDRVIATYGVRAIPRAWIAQTRPGGLVVAPWGTGYSNRDAVAVLTVEGDGTASGWFTRPVEFMKARTDRADAPRHGDYVTDSDRREETHSALAGREVIGGHWDAPGFVLGLLLPAVTRAVDDRDPDAPVLWLYGLGDTSWTAGIGVPGGGSRVLQAGPRRLWDALEAAWDWWTGQGSPGIERFGITADGDGETVWLDEPDRPVPQFSGT